MLTKIVRTRPVVPQQQCQRMAAQQAQLAAGHRRAQRRAVLSHWHGPARRRVRQIRAQQILKELEEQRMAQAHLATRSRRQGPVAVPAAACGERTYAPGGW